MKNILLLLFIVASVQTLSQLTVKFAGVTSGTGSTNPRDIAHDSEGNLIIAGFFSGEVDMDITSGTQMHTEVSMTGIWDNNIVIQKLNSEGELVWSKSWPSISGNSMAWSTEVDANDNIYVGGAYEGTVDFDPGSAEINHTSSDYEDGFLMKLDKNGNILWVKTFHGAGYMRIAGIEIDDNQDLICLFDFADSVDIDPSAATNWIVGLGSWDSGLAKFDANGNHIWSFRISSPYFDTDTYMALDPADNILVTVTTEDWIDFDPLATTAYGLDFGGDDVYIAKYNNDGQFMWVKTIGGTGNETVDAITTDPFGNVIVVGSFSGTVDMDPGASTYYLSSLGGADVFVLSLTPSGGFSWAKKFGNSATDYFRCVSVSPDNIIHIGARASGNIDIDPGSGVVNFPADTEGDSFILKLDALGNYVNHLSLAGTGGTSSLWGILFPLNAIYAAGQFNGNINLDPFNGSLNFNSSPSAYDHTFAVAFCEYSTATISVDTCGTYTSPSGLYTYTTSGVYFDTIPSATFCDSIITINLTLKENPVIEAGEDILACEGDLISVNATGADNYEWSPAVLNGEFFNAPGTSQYFVVKGINLDNCFAQDSLLLTIKSNDECNSPFYNNAFSPNNDGLNDFLYINGAENTTNTFKVFNRWGDLIYTIDNYDNEGVRWDGTNNSGEPLPAGTYFVTFTVSGENAEAAYIQIVY